MILDLNGYISENLLHDDNEESEGRICWLLHVMNHILQSCPPTRQRLVMLLKFSMQTSLVILSCSWKKNWKHPSLILTQVANSTPKFFERASLKIFIISVCVCLCVCTCVVFRDKNHMTGEIFQIILIFSMLKTFVLLIIL